MITKKEYIYEVTSFINSLYDYMFFSSPIDEIKDKYIKLTNLNFDVFYNELNNIKNKMYRLIELIISKDKACKNKEEIIYSHLGFESIFSYRIAHIFYINKEYLLAKTISSISHGLTGIDINPGAQIGDDFFIDHGTGIVIGETSIIGNNVTMFHGVTLGTNNIDKICSLKRHPTILDNVILYSNCTILGGSTIIGNNVIIGCNVVINESISDNSIVKLNKNYIIKK